MPDPTTRHLENAPGRLYVDASCKDCGMCRHIAPGTFARSEITGSSFVFQQPEAQAELALAAEAAAACPEKSIGASDSVLNERTDKGERALLAAVDERDKAVHSWKALTRLKRLPEVVRLTARPSSVAPVHDFNGWTWYFELTATPIERSQRIVEFGVFSRPNESEPWRLTTDTRRVWGGREFAEWFRTGCPVICHPEGARGTDFRMNRSTPQPGQSMWYLIGIDSSGNEGGGFTIVEEQPSSIETPPTRRGTTVGSALGGLLHRLAEWIES